MLDLRLIELCHLFFFTIKEQSSTRHENYNHPTCRKRKILLTRNAYYFRQLLVDGSIACNHDNS